MKPTHENKPGTPIDVSIEAIERGIDALAERPLPPCPYCGNILKPAGGQRAMLCPNCGSVTLNGETPLAQRYVARFGVTDGEEETPEPGPVGGAVEEDSTPE